MTTDVSCDLEVKYVDGRYWVLTQAFKVTSTVVGRVIVGRGFRTNFNSIPRLFWNIMAPDEYAKGAVVHDKLYSLHGFEDPWTMELLEETTRAEVDPHGVAAVTNMIPPRVLPVTRKQADQVHCELTKACGAPGWKANAMYWALRAFGWKVWNDYQDPTARPLDPAKRPDKGAAPEPQLKDRAIEDWPQLKEKA